MILKNKIMDKKDIRRSLMRLSHEITEKNKGTENIAIIGIKNKGISVANIIKENLEKIEDKKVLYGEIDVSPYRDDIKKSDYDSSSIDFDINGKTIILVDDVLFTGRTVRAAMEGIIKRGRPLAIQLLVLIDRGHREFPIKADYIGKNIPTSKSKEEISLKIVNSGNEEEEGVYIYEK
ncbi:MAG: bifunctional pyr operon transcriptional regulator/uracil phosphoribosyltransferase PyrR [Thermotogae bacterium]|nr:bifunctional pyr operon transcriptional regulator/uracil phosphoribosyltransferase PyrR [Thermotogota bacterium]